MPRLEADENDRVVRAVYRLPLKGLDTSAGDAAVFFLSKNSLAYTETKIDWRPRLLRAKLSAAEVPQRARERTG